MQLLDDAQVSARKDREVAAAAAAEGEEQDDDVICVDMQSTVNLRLPSDVSQRWISTIYMIRQVLLLWFEISSVYTRMEKICPLGTQQVEIAQLYSLVEPLGHLMTKSQKTDVYIRVELVYLKVDLWVRTLDTSGPLQVQHPLEEKRRTMGKEIDGNQQWEAADLSEVVNATRGMLRDEIFKRVTGPYALESVGEKRNWIDDEAMYLFPAVGPKMTHVKPLLAYHPGNRIGTIWTFDKIVAETRQRLMNKMVMVQEAQAKKTTVSTQPSIAAAAEKAGGGVRSSSKASTSRLEIIDAMLSEDEDYTGQTDETPAEAAVFKEKAANEMQKYEERCKRYSSKMAPPAGKTSLAPDGIVAWWLTNKQEFPLLFEVFTHVQGCVPSSAQIERDFSAASLVLPARRNRLSPRWFQAQLLCLLNFDSLPKPEELSSVSPSIEKIESMMPTDGFLDNKEMDPDEVDERGEEEKVMSEVYKPGSDEEWGTDDEGGD